MPTTTFSGRSFLTGLSFFFFLQFALFFQSCKKTGDRSATEEIAANTEQAATGKKPRNPPPFYFSNCSSPVINGNFIAGAPTSARITLNYINSPGGPYPSFTSATINGITLAAPAGVLNNGSGSIVYTASGTPISTGFYAMPVSIGGSSSCTLQINVLNAPSSGGGCSDPSSAVGSTGCIKFLYKGQLVTYTTVRAADGKIWLQQNLGSPRVAFHSDDVASFGDYFQWGRWDDGHQSPGSPAITGSTLLQNPSQISSGNPNFIKGTTASTSWWTLGASTANTWSGTNISSTNGKDPCTALGPGWHLPGVTEWSNVLNRESITEIITAFESNLKLPASGFRVSLTGQVQLSQSGNYWTSTAAANRLFFDHDSYNSESIAQVVRGYGFSCRCVKN